MGLGGGETRGIIGRDRDAGRLESHLSWTGITAYLENPEDKLEHAQPMAAHSDLKSTSLYDWRSDEVSMDEFERFAF